MGVTRRPRAWPVLVTWGAVFVAVQCLGGLALAALALSGGGSLAEAGERMSRIVATRGALLTGAAFTSSTFALVAGVAGLLAPEGPRRRLRLERGRGRVATTVLMLMAILMLGQAADSAVSLLGWGGTGSLGAMARAMQGVSGPMLAVSILVLGVMAGTGEELFFRGFMQTRLRQRLGPWPAIAITALAFGITHADPVHGVLALLLGVYLGWATEITGSVWPAAAVHAANNAVWVLLVAFLPLDLGARVHAVLVVVLLPAGAALVALLRQLHPGGMVAPAPATPTD